MMEALVTRKEVARLLRCSLASLHRMMRQERLPSLKVGGKTLFRRADIEAWLQVHTRHAPAEPNTAPRVLTQARPSGLPAETIEEVLVALFQAMVDPKHPTALPLRHVPGPATLAQANAILAAHGIALHTEPTAGVDMVDTYQDAEGHEVRLIIQAKAVPGRSGTSR
jgi:excisionase family DNA binding protein